MPRSRLRRIVAAAPWPVKLGGKLILARLPVSNDRWARLTLFKHGAMDDPAYAYGVFTKHFERASPRAGFVALELGPGDSAFSAVIAAAYGARRTYLIDVDDFACRDVELYLDMARFLRHRGLPAPDLTGVRSLDEVLARCSAGYLTDGVASLRQLPDGSIDFSWSHAVLEHVRKAELPVMLRELHRVTALGGASSHVIDLEDHLAHALNNLRFPEGVWESRLFAESGFYTNRMRRSQLLELFQSTGFEIEVVAEDRWERLPTSRAALAEEFRRLEEDELGVRGVEVVLTRL
jgi:hypothetical protein